MKIEICVQCIDEGRVPRHQIITWEVRGDESWEVRGDESWEVRGDESWEVRMRKVCNAVVKALKQEYPKP
jgi:hypothetical protein